MAKSTKCWMIILNHTQPTINQKYLSHNGSDYRWEFERETALLMTLQAARAFIKDHLGTAVHATTGKPAKI